MTTERPPVVGEEDGGLRAVWENRAHLTRCRPPSQGVGGCARTRAGAERTTI